jgi:hypothetical protein
MVAEAKAMNKIVREHYPVERLPEDLRQGLPAGQTVTITVEEEAHDPDSFDRKVEDILKNPQPMTVREVRALVGSRDVTPGEAVARVRTLRDEWE